MSLKTDIMRAVMDRENKDVITVKINNISRLERWTANAINEPVDKLIIRFSYVSGCPGGALYEIKGRTYETIIDEIKQYTRAYLAECATWTCKDIDAGYVPG